jgi:hypothetical protein
MGGRHVEPGREAGEAGAVLLHLADGLAGTSLARSVPNRST